MYEMSYIPEECKNQHKLYIIFEYLTILAYQKNKLIDENMFTDERSYLEAKSLIGNTKSKLSRTCLNCELCICYDHFRDLIVKFLDKYFKQLVHHNVCGMGKLNKYELFERVNSKDRQEFIDLFTVKSMGIFNHYRLLY
jgi:hypothetical protein